ncbi:MGMT family protein [Thalassotalea sp. LPB0316]|uniref:MGMT family protein n=1 Tax=Thalassotalea sp. LPB0316 TaxID=2769490 RepID=UPI001868E477|nr:MGMT family protein [Thalassotalea sp. LPB0316]QOL24486.1 MGMT family protein [Thalassotalea sp. LPB0316]
MKESYQRIWQTVQAIPRGCVASYGQIADLAGLPGRARLVGKALKSSDDGYYQGQVIPWQRVVNSQGKISLPKHSPEFEQQVALLQEEQVVVINGKINLAAFGWQPDLSTLLFALKF